jgi:DNA-binding CsgD family transcriptional regulator
VFGKPFRSNRHIKSADVKKMLRFLHALHEIQSVERFGDHIIRLLDEMSPGTPAVFEEAGLDGIPIRYAHTFDISKKVELKLLEALIAFHHQKPIIHYLQEGGAETAVRNSDLITMRDLKKTDIYHHFFLPLGAWHQLYAVIPLAGTTLKFSFQRDQDFSDDMREVFGLLTNHVSLAYRNAQKMDALRKITPLETAGPNPDKLTEREKEILHWIQQGKRNSEVGMILRISERTVEKHMENILRKLKVETRTSAALSASSGN